MRNFIFPALLLSKLFLQAQVANNNQVISMTDGVTISIQGVDVLNNGDWQNNGHLRIDQNWTNSGFYISTSGQFLLIGNDQTIGHGNSNFNSLSIQGGGIKNFITDVSILSRLTLESGLLNTGEFGLYLNSGVELVGGTTDSYIIGSLFRMGTEDLFYPIGTESDFLSATLTDLSDPLTEVGIRVYDEAPQMSAGSGIEEVSSNHFWEIMTETEIPANGLVLPVVNEDFVTDEDAIAMAFSDGTNPFESLENTAFDGSAELGNLSYSGPVRAGVYAIATSSSEDPPITVINLVTGNNDGKHDFLRIDNITFYDGNKVEIFNRTGQKVFEMSDYNNTDRVFTGRANVGGTELLPTGSYFFSIKLGKKNTSSGFIYVKN